jgi:hypothetical protein
MPCYLNHMVLGAVYAATVCGVPGEAPATITPTDETAQGDTDQSEEDPPATAIVFPLPRLAR